MPLSSTIAGVLRDRLLDGGVLYIAIAQFGKMPSQKESEDLRQRLKPVNQIQPKSSEKPANRRASATIGLD